MGMDLISSRKRTNTPPEIAAAHPHGFHLHYNWTGWTFLVTKLREWNVNTDEFSGTNDGDLLSRKTCAAVAQALEEHIQELSKEDQEWLRPHIDCWKYTFNYKQC